MWPFRRARPVVFKLPAVVPSGRGVYFRTDAVPSVDALLEVVPAWLAGRAAENVAGAVLEMIRSPLMHYELRPAAGVPLPPEYLLGRPAPDASHVLMMAAHDARRWPRFGLLALEALSRAVALHLDGTIFDPDSVQLHPPERREESLPPDGWLPVGTQIAIFSSVEGTGRMTTSGMAKYGLPDLELDDYPPNLARPLGMLVNGIAHQLVMQTFERDRLDPVLTLTSADVGAALGRVPEFEGQGDLLLHYPTGLLGGRPPFVRLRPPPG